MSTVPAPRRVGFNLLYLVPGEVGGSEVYARELLRAIAEAKSDLELVVYTGPEGAELLRAEPWAGAAEIVVAPVRSRSKLLRIAAELTWLPRRAKRDRVDLLHSLGTTAPLRCPMPSVVSVLDLIYEHFPHTFPRASRAGLRALVPRAARAADRVIAISQAARQDVIATLGVAAERVDVVYLGLGQPSRVEPTAQDELARRFNLHDCPSLLTVSAALEHKNLPRLLEAFKRLRSVRQLDLVIVGRGGLEMDALRTRAAQLGVADRVRFTGWIDENDLEGLYARSDLFVYPSLMEGFGLPVLEAMARGLPVACSGVSAIAEVAGEAAQQFDPYDVESIAGAVGALLDDRARRDSLVERGYERCRDFSWERCALDTLEVYGRALGLPSSTTTVRQ